jgi:hypothetical protein
MPCPFSGTEISLSMKIPLPVECPMCQAVRRIPTRHIFPDMVIYPSHDQPDSFRPRRRYKYVDHTWTIVE